MPAEPCREPWNKGKIVGQKAPFKLKDVWVIRGRLQLAHRERELALVNLGIVPAKFRSCIMIRLNSSICVALSVCFFAGSPGIHAAEIAKYDDGPFAGKGRPYSESARVGDLLFLTGQTGEDKDGNLVAGGIKAEAEQIMLNIKAAHARRGLATEHVVKCTVFLADITEWAAFNEVYKRHFSQPYPARSALGASGLVDKARVEMECIAGYPR